MADLSSSFAAIERRLKCASLYAPSQTAFLDNPAWEDATARFLLVRLSPWRDVDRSTPHLFLHRLVRSTLGPDAYVDFAFFPSRPDRAILDAASLPWLSGIASRRSAEDFDAVLISCSYALELVNLPALLQRSNIPVRASGRRLAASPSGQPWPPVVLGGSSALASQGAFFPDGDAFFDAIFFGEGEDGGAEVVRSLASTRGRSAAERMADLERASAAVWAAGFGPPASVRADGKVRRVRPGRCRLLPREGEAHGAERGPLLLESYPLLNSDEASTARLQISWGCPSFCTFCFEGWERKPYRELPLDRVLESARNLARNTGASTLEIYSFNFNAHEQGLQLVLELNRLFDKVNMMSQRADILARTPGMLAVELAAEKRSFTVGVEGISAGMRAFYAKDLADAELWQLLQRLVREKIRELKLFYIIAGVETGEDVEEFRLFCAALRQLADERGPGLRVVFSAGYLVRMPFTPLRGIPLALEREPLVKIADSLKEATEAQGFEFRLAQDWNEYVADQLIVAGGYGLAEGLEAAAAAGALYDAGVEGDLVGHLVRALRASGELDSGEERSARRLEGPLVREKPTGHRYPLDFIDAGVNGAFLDARAKEAQGRTERGSCLGDDEGDGACLGCSACEDADERSFLAKHRVQGAPGTALADRTAAVIKEKRRARPVHLKLVIPASLAGSRPAALSAALMRAALGAEPRLVGRLLRIEEALWTSPVWQDRMGPGSTGETVVALYGVGGEDSGRNPSLPAEDAEIVRSALEAALGTPAEILHDFELASLSAVEASVSFPDAQEALRSIRVWLAALKLSATERKTASGRTFDIAPKDRKKRIVLSVELVQENGGGAEARVSGGGKLNLIPLLSPGIHATEVKFSRP